MSADEIPASVLELLTRDWKDVLRHAKGMQLAIKRYDIILGGGGCIGGCALTLPQRFTENIVLSVNECHSSESQVSQDAAFYGDQLDAVGDQNLEFVENVEKDVEPLAMALVSEPSDEGAAVITQSLATAQASTIRALGTAILDIAEGSNPRSEFDPAVEGGEAEQDGSEGTG